MSGNTRARSGFALVEIAIAAAVLVIVIGMAMTGLLYTMSSSTQSNIQAELDVDVQASMERIKQDMRLTSLDEIVYYPAGPGPYSAISFPIASDLDHDGVIDCDTNGAIIWAKTLVYHVWATAPYQLRLTTFNPRPSLTPVQLQQQINSVVTNGNGIATYGGSNATTEVIFENLFTWSVTPLGSRYDGYAPSNTVRDVNARLGSCVISNGNHTFKFTAIGSNTASSGYAIGLDSLVVSPSYGDREAEAQLPVTAQSGATAVAQYSAGADWSGNYYLNFPATATGHTFTLTMENDRWEETNFRGIGSLCENTGIEFDESLAPKDFVVRLQGNTWAWYVNEQTEDAVGSAPALDDLLNGCAVRVLLKGSQMLGGGWVKYDGQFCYVWFDGVDAARKLKVDAAYIAECASALNPTPNTVGTPRRITFTGGSYGNTFPDAGGYNWSDRVSLPIDRDKTYVVSFLVGPGVGNGNAWQWTDATNMAVQSYVLPSAAESDLIDADWTSKTNMISTNRVFGLHYLWTRYPTNGLYTSPIFDTHLDAPAYSTMGWNATASGCSLLMRVRTGTNEYLYDALAWTNPAITTLTAPGALSTGNRRYIQFQADLRSDASCCLTPTLKDVTIRWPGEARLVDVGGTMVKGPNYGVWKLEVDGVELREGVLIDLTIYEDVRSHGQSMRLTSSLTSEVRPRNTGR